MRTRILNRTLKLAVAGIVVVASWGLSSAKAEFEVSASMRITSPAEFYGPLSRFGGWVQVGSYGRCWRPKSVALEWRPYCDGHWVWTDCGWFWASDEPWAWACYHYGCWVNDSTYGWVWVPGTDWAPAWVSWRVGGGYIGWAPLPPHGVRVAEPQFVFVTEARFTEPLRPAVVTVDNEAIFKRTSKVNKVKRNSKTFEGGVRQQVVINEGPGVAGVEKAVGRKVRVVPIREAAHQVFPPARGSAERHGPAGEWEHRQPPGKQAAPGHAPGPERGKANEREHGNGGKEHGKDLS